MPDPKHVLVIGAGFSGAVISRELASAGHRVIVLDERPHVAGNCHTERDADSGVMVHVYGPHIFHTDDEEVWSYINRFCEMVPYRNQVKARAGDQIYSMPVNLHTINQFFSKSMDPATARAFVESLSEGGGAEPVSFEDQALRFMGRDLYQAFFRGYTRKHWGVEPDRLPASILKRLPLRFTYDDNYFFHRHQGIPREGYTHAVTQILDHPGIELQLSTQAEDFGSEGYDHVVYTGPLDRYFGHAHGRLSYRTLRFERELTDAPFQGTAVMNYCDEDVPFTRITEHMYFAPWEVEKFRKSVIFREYSAAAGPDDIPYYPVRLLDDKVLLDCYVSKAQATIGATFAGRLGTYAYLDMDVAIKRALDVARHLAGCFQADITPKPFVHPM